MKTYNSFINFLCSLMAIDIPDVYYHYKNQYYDLEKSEIKPFESGLHGKWSRCLYGTCP